MNADLSEGRLPSLLREIYVGRRNGWLHLAHGEERQSLRFRRGNIVNAHTNVVEERLGEMMVRHGRLSAADLARATEIVIREKKRLGEVLGGLGIMDASGLEDAVAMHAYETLAKVFSWTDGGYSFEAEQESEEPELTLKLSTGELILAAVRAISDPRVVRDALGDADRVLVLSNDPILRFQKLTLSPADGFLLSRVDGTASAREIVQMSPLPSEDAERSLLGLLSTGFIEYASEPRRPRRAQTSSPHPAAAGAPASSGGASAASSEPRPAAPQPSISRPPPPQTQPRPPAPPEEKIEERRREIVALWETLKTRNHFELLGLSRSVTEIEVKEAYFRLAKRFHPDAHHDRSLSDLRDKLEAVFIRLGEAYDVLRDPRRRGDYEHRLGRPRPSPAGVPSPPAAQRGPESHSGSAPAIVPAAAPATLPAPAGDPEVEPELAETAIGHAAKLFDQERYWDVIQMLEPVLRAARGRLRTRGRMLLARSYLKNPKWARRAEEALLEVTREDPRAADAWVLLGGIYEGKQMRARALSMYKKALELNPDHEEARRYVTSHPPEEPPPPPEAGGSLLRKLFRKP